MKHPETTPSTVLVPTESKEKVDAFLEPLLRARTEEARRINPHYETLWQDIQKLYVAGGKRLRSYMTLLSYSAFSNQPVDTILPAAAAQELLHTAMLVHDDIIDRDDIRYGVKNISREYTDHYEEIIKDEIDRRHYANSAAILAGDLLISEAYTLIAETPLDPKVIIASQRLLGQAMFQVVGGELLDTEAAFRGADSADPIVIAEQKTASYSFVSPLLMGATLAEAPEAQLEILQQLGEQVGIAYQLRDDVLGVFGDTTKTGKSNDNDLREGKRTFLIEEFQKLASEEQKQSFNAVFGRHDVTTNEIQHAKELLIHSGAKAAIEELIAAYQQRAHALLTMLAIDAPHSAMFATLIDLCLKRDK